MGFVAKGLVSIPFKKKRKKNKIGILFHFTLTPLLTSLLFSVPFFPPKKVFIDFAEKKKQPVVKFRSVCSTTQSHLILRHSLPLT